MPPNDSMVRFCEAPVIDRNLPSELNFILQASTDIGQFFQKEVFAFEARAVVQVFYRPLECYEFRFQRLTSTKLFSFPAPPFSPFIKFSPCELVWYSRQQRCERDSRS